MTRGFVLSTAISVRGPGPQTSHLGVSNAALQANQNRSLNLVDSHRLIWGEGAREENLPSLYFLPKNDFFLASALNRV